MPHKLSASDFFSRAQERLTFDVPVGFFDPNVIPRHDEEDADPAVVAAIAAVRPIRLAAVLVPIIERDEPSVLFTQRTAHLTNHAGQISFPGGKIDAIDESPAAAALRKGHACSVFTRSGSRAFAPGRNDQFVLGGFSYLRFPTNNPSVR